jgi:FdhD protein
MDFTQGAVLITSRASYEMVQKSVQMGIGIVIAVSAPSALAIRMAESYHLTLIGYARSGRHGVYSHPERLLIPRVPDRKYHDLSP